MLKKLVKRNFSMWKAITNFNFAGVFNFLSNLHIFDSNTWLGSVESKFIPGTEAQRWVNREIAVWDQHPLPNGWKTYVWKTCMKNCKNQRENSLRLALGRVSFGVHSGKIVIRTQIKFSVFGRPNSVDSNT